MYNISFRKITNYIIYIYAFTMPFEQSVMPIIGITYGKLFGGILMVMLLRTLSLKRLYNLYLPLFLFVLWLIIIEIVKSQTIHRMVGSLSQSVFLMMLLYNYLYNKPKVREYMFFALMLSVGYIGLKVILGINVSYSDDGRMIYEGTGINSIGVWAAMSVIIVLNYWKNKIRTKIIYIFLITIPLYLNIIMQGASRGSLVVLLVGILGVYVFGNQKISSKVVNYLIAGVLVFFIWNIAMESPIMSQRMIKLLETGDETRTSVWEVVIPIFLDNPVSGVSPSNYFDVIEPILGVKKDVHNAYLYILVTSGIIGGAFFLVFLINIFRFVYKNARKSNNYIFLILLLIQFFDWFKGGGSLYPKTTWFVITYILSGSLFYEYRLKQKEFIASNVKLIKQKFTLQNL